MLATLAILAQEANERTTDTILLIIAAVLVIAGFLYIIRSRVLGGIMLLIIGFLVGPGGVSLLD